MIMSSLNASLNEIDAVNYSSRMFFHVWSYFLIFLGSIGHSFNAYVFTRPTLRSNPCVQYFLASTISGFFATLINMPLRLSQFIYNRDAFGYSSASCKVLTFIVTWSRAQTSWYIALASIDRFLCSSTSIVLRAWSTVRVAIHAILLSTILCGIFYVYVAIQYKTRKILPACPANQGDYPIFNGIWNLLVFSLAPTLIMLLFGLLTIRNIKQSRNKISIINRSQQIQNFPQLASSHTYNRRQRSGIDGQLIQMMLFQCTYFILFSTPVSVWYIYDSLRMNITIDPLQKAKDAAFSMITGILSITGACTSFYIFTLSSKLFRNQLKNLFIH